jgi:hypothetical protein
MQLLCGWGAGAVQACQEVPNPPLRHFRRKGNAAGRVGQLLFLRVSYHFALAVHSAAHASASPCRCHLTTSPIRWPQLHRTSTRSNARKRFQAKSGLRIERLTNAASDELVLASWTGDYPVRRAALRLSFAAR